MSTKESNVKGRALTLKDTENTEEGEPKGDARIKERRKQPQKHCPFDSLRSLRVTVEIIRRLAQRATNLAHDAQHRIIKFVHHTLLERDDGVVSDLDALRADLSA